VTLVRCLVAVLVCVGCSPTQLPTVAFLSPESDGPEARDEPRALFWRTHSPPSRASAADGRLCVVTTDGGLECRGNDRDSAMGQGRLARFPASVLLETGSDRSAIVDVIATARGVCFVTMRGVVECSGRGLGSFVFRERFRFTRGALVAIGDDICVRDGETAQCFLRLGEPTYPCRESSCSVEGSTLPVRGSALAVVGSGG